MAGPSVKIDAARTQRGLVPAESPRRRRNADAVLSLWAGMIYHAVQDAKHTRHGLPSDRALLARWWIEEHRPEESNRREWERSFACACGWLGLDAAAERVRLGRKIDEAWQAAWLKWVRPLVAERRALVLTWCTQRYARARPVAVRRQLVLPWPAEPSEPDYEDVVGIEHGDPPGAYLPPQAA